MDSRLTTHTVAQFSPDFSLQNSAAVHCFNRAVSKCSEMSASASAIAHEFAHPRLLRVSFSFHFRLHTPDAVNCIYININTFRMHAEFVSLFKMCLFTSNIVENHQIPDEMGVV